MIFTRSGHTPSVDTVAGRLGVEEEYHLVDADTLELTSRPEVFAAATELLGDTVQHELLTSQLELATPATSSLDNLRSELVALRRAALSAAESHSTRLLAASVHPTASWTSEHTTPGGRYEGISERWGILASQQVITGCHVHVSVGDDPEVAIHVLDRIRSELPLLLALTCSSPIWESRDTSWHSFRTVWFSHFPTTGPPPLLGSRRIFDELVTDAATSGLLPDASHLYWDARPSTRFPTVEVRIADTMPRLDDVVCYAGIVRALVATAFLEARLGLPPLPVPDQTLRLARARAARFGLEDELLDLRARQLRPAPELARDLLTRLRPALEDLGEFEEVQALLEDLLARGTASMRSRHLLKASSSPQKVLESLLDETSHLPPL